MCEINPKRKQFFRLEFFTAHIMTDARWEELVHKRLLELEQSFNESGEIRVHIHEEDDGA
jgi:hypothetical protein